MSQHTISSIGYDPHRGGLFLTLVGHPHPLLAPLRNRARIHIERILSELAIGTSVEVERSESGTITLVAGVEVQEAKDSTGTRWDSDIIESMHFQPDPGQPGASHLVLHLGRHGTVVSNLHVDPMSSLWYGNIVGQSLEVTRGNQTRNEVTVTLHNGLPVHVGPMEVCVVKPSIIDILVAVERTGDGVLHMELSASGRLASTAPVDPELVEEFESVVGFCVPVVRNDEMRVVEVSDLRVCADGNRTRTEPVRHATTDRLNRLTWNGHHVVANLHTHGAVELDVDFTDNTALETMTETMAENMFQNPHHRLRNVRVGVKLVDGHVVQVAGIRARQPRQHCSVVRVLETSIDRERPGFLMLFLNTCETVALDLTGTNETGLKELEQYADGRLDCLVSGPGECEGAYLVQRDETGLIRALGGHTVEPVQ